jgi:hypothetical protein
MIKVYRAIRDRSLAITIQISKDDSRRIEFTGGDHTRSGSFSTDNEVLQKAMEKSPMLGKFYKLEKTYGNTTISQDAENPIGEIANIDASIEKAEISDAIKGEVGNTAAEGNGPIPGFVEKVFRTLNEAQSFLKSEPYKVQISKMRTSMEIIETGKGLGFDITFNKD